MSIQTADCVPIYIFDFKTEYYGIFHSGWRGTKNKIISKALNMFINDFKSITNNILIVIGPHIKKCCYEIDWDVAQHFSFLNKNNQRNKWLLSLEKEIVFDALNLGILNDKIHT